MLSKTLAFGDSTFTTLSHYGILNYHMGYYIEAEKYLFKARQINPTNTNIMNYLASTYGFTGKAQKGLEILDELDRMIASFDSIGLRAIPQRAYLLRVLNRYAEATEVYIQATKIFPDEPLNYYEVARCYDIVFNKRLALEWYTRYLEKIDPNWATRNWTTQELEKLALVNAAMERISSLRLDLFFEEEKRR